MFRFGRFRESGIPSRICLISNSPGIIFANLLVMRIYIHIYAFEYSLLICILNCYAYLPVDTLFANLRVMRIYIYKYIYICIFACLMHINMSCVFTCRFPAGIFTCYAYLYIYTHMHIYLLHAYLHVTRTQMQICYLS